MSEIPNISQTTAMGSDNTQIGVQYNIEEHYHQGLTVSDATAMAFAMFREYYPQLRQEALSSLKLMVEEKLRDIPADCIEPPTARITVPTLQKASITEEHEIRELYANLLSNSMNSVVKNGVHPSFVEIINQLSPDEAKILKFMHTHNRGIPTIGIKLVFSHGGHAVVLRDFSNVPELSGCEHALESEKYIDNLVRLGLAKRSVQEWYHDEGVYEPLKKHKHIYSQFCQYEAAIQKEDTLKSVEYEKGFCELTAFGKSFCRSCIDNVYVVILPNLDEQEGDK